MELTATTPDSSMIARMAWEDEDLTVTFTNGTVYRYTGVPLTTMAEVLTAESVGNSFWHHVRHAFPYEKLIA